MIFRNVIHKTEINNNNKLLHEIIAVKINYLLASADYMYVSIVNFKVPKLIIRLSNGP